jgi:hypothetical protein
VAKLRYIRGSLDRYRPVVRGIEAVPSATVRRLLYRWLSLEGLRHLMVVHPLGAPFDARTRRSMHLSRVTAATYRPSRPTAATPVLAAVVTPKLEAVAEALPVLPAGMKLAQAWVVEKGDGWEQYSNGLRIDTSFATPGEPRRYRSFDARTGAPGELRQRPVGILFHTSESDIWPLESSNNEKLRESSRRLLLYCQRLRLYNYMVDRFGRVFRLVEEDGRANHAGAAVWSKDDTVFLSLNNAFLGICFETRWEGGRALPITVAQLTAARNLTEYLRQRWEIPPDMCSTHGIASVNPVKHLIGHHVDWARGFPFEAFGLPDQYARPAPSVALFGFGYDGDFLKVMGEPWPGVRLAEKAMAADAARAGRSVDGLRRERQTLYDRWHSEQTREEEAAQSQTTAGARTRS